MELQQFEGAATIEKVASLCRRRAFVFPSSDIYGGLGSSFDFGHYGVLLNDNVKAEWRRSLIQERDDVVALDSAIILNPQVWVASGHVGGFSDPLVDCRTCKLRFRADQLEQSACGKRPSKHPGEIPDCDLTEPREFNLMFETFVGAGARGCVARVPAAGDGTGHLRQLQERHVLDAREAALRHRADRQELPQRDHARQLPLPHARVRADGDGVLRAPGRGRRMAPRTGSTSAAAGISTSGCASRTCASGRTNAAELSHYSSATSDIEYLYPIGWLELEGVANRGDYDLRQHTEASGTTLEWIGHEERYVPYVIEPAISVVRSTLAFLCDAYDEEVVADRPRTLLRLHPRLAPVKAAVLPLIGKDTAMVEQARGLYEDLRTLDVRRVRRRRGDRQAVSAPGRDRNAVGVDDRRADARRRHRHAARPRHARAGADPDRRREALLLDRLEQPWQPRA